MNNTLIGLFAKRNDAQTAVGDLVDAGFDRSDTRLVSAISAHGVEDLVALGAPRAEAELYAQRVEAGDTLVVVTADAEKLGRAHEILDRDGAADLGAGTSTSAATVSAAPMGDRLEVVEETLQVGKREVETGGMRVRSFVTEKAVSEQVNLREEHVDVKRTKVDRPATDADFRTGTIEMRETAEVPVVAKEARVVEEISLGKTATERTETVSDTVRRTDFEVERIGESEVHADHAPTFQEHLATADPSASYERHEPAYAYGSALANDPTMGAAEFDEDSHKETWEKSNPGTWDEFKASVKHAFETVKSKV